MNRCEWAHQNVDMLIYHDTEWGVIETNPQRLFEKLSLEIFQAGLSWKTVLQKRNALRQAFHNFNIDKVSQYDNQDMKRLMNSPSIIHNQAKILAIVDNAKVCQRLDLYEMTWRPFNYTTLDHLKCSSKLSHKQVNDAFISKYVRYFKNNGFKRIGPITLYSYYQSVGIVNDHEVNCYRHDEIMQQRNIKNFTRKLRNENRLKGD